MPGEKLTELERCELSRLAYETFCGACSGRQFLEWDDLPPLIHDAWRITLDTILEHVYAALDHPLVIEDSAETEKSNVNP
jgi:hypothetical protein